MHPSRYDGSDNHQVRHEGEPMKVEDLQLAGHLIEAEHQAHAASHAEVIVLDDFPFVAGGLRRPRLGQLVDDRVLNIYVVHTLHEGLQGLGV